MTRSDLRVGFLREARSYLPAIIQALRTYHDDTRAHDALAEAHRLVHTIQGASSTAGLPELSQFAFALEDLLHVLLTEHRALDSRTLRTCERALHEIHAFLVSAGAEGSVENSLSLSQSSDATSVLREVQALTNLARGAGHGASPVESDKDRKSRELAEIFKFEASDHLAHMARSLRELNDPSRRTEALATLQRSSHTLKGAAAMVGFPDVTRVAHRLEGLIEQLSSGQTEFNDDRKDLLYASSDLINDLVHDPAKSSHEEAIRTLLARYDASAVHSRAEPAALGSRPSSTYPLSASQEAPVLDQPTVSPATDSASQNVEFVRAPLRRLDDLAGLLSGLTINRSAATRLVQDAIEFQQELDRSLERFERTADQMETDHSLRTMSDRYSEQSLSHAIGEFDNLEFDSYSELHILLKGLTETARDLRAASLGLTKSLNQLKGLDATQASRLREVEHGLTRLRMVPFETIADRLERTVRVAAKVESKQVRFAVRGGDIDLDKFVLEELSHVLLHLLRNAVSHGLESPVARERRDKPPEGNVNVAVDRRGAEFIITVTDDGSGIDAEAVRTRGIQAGVLAPDEAETIERDQLLQLIFRHGFTTSDAVSEISGRGVGLDVVREKIRNLKGRVSVASRVGHGTSFELRLPLRQSAARVVLLSSQDQTVALPQVAVERILKFDPDEMRLDGNGETIRIGSRSLPLLELDRVLGLPDLHKEFDTTQPLLLVRCRKETACLVADRVLAGGDVALRNLGSHLKQVHGVSGATIAGDGSVVLVLNPDEFLASPATSRRPHRDAPASYHVKSNVLIVDDSLSVRTVLANLLTRNGYQTTEAKDGFHALELLQSQEKRPDVILMDIEMPRMNGFELASALRRDRRFESIPIVVLTSRSGSKHREKAFSLGVNDYLAKPFNETTLVEMIAKVLDSEDRNALDTSAGRTLANE